MVDEAIPISNRLKDDEFTVYEKARIIGSRALQISQGAKPAVKLTKKQLEDIGYNPVELAKLEFESGKIPISVRRSMPEKPKEE